MSTMELADTLVALCRQGRNLEAIETLYADDVVSFEVTEPMRETRGLDNVLGKARWWQGAHEVHGASVDGPWPHGDRFIVRFQFDVTQKETGHRIQMDEVGLFTVRNGKVAEETFFYRT